MARMAPVRHPPPYCVAGGDFGWTWRGFQRCKVNAMAGGDVGWAWSGFWLGMKETRLWACCVRFLLWWVEE